MSQLDARGLLVKLAAPRRRIFVLIVLLMFTGSLVSLSVPWLAGRLSNSLMVDGGFVSAAIVTCALILLVTVYSLVMYRTNVLLAAQCEGVAVDLRAQLHRHLLSLPMPFHWQTQSSRLMSTMSYDIDVVAGYLTSTLLGLSRIVVTSLGAIIIVATMNSLIALSLAVVLPVLIVIAKVQGRLIRPISQKLATAYSSAFETAYDHLRHVLLLKLAGRQTQATQILTARNDEYLEIHQQLAAIEAKLTPITVTIGLISLLFVIWIGTDSIATASTGEIVSIVLYALLIIRPMGQLADTYGQTMNFLGASERLLGYLNTIPEREQGLQLHDVAGNIAATELSVAYQPGVAVLDQLTLNLRAGEFVVLQGANGAGKSTLLKVIAGLVPKKGELLIDEVDVEKIAPASLRSHVAYIPQSTVLPETSIRACLSFLNDRASDEEMWQALNLVAASRWVLSMDRGLDCVIGESGRQISGGEQQKIALAMGILSNRPILLLDEVTSMFDADSETYLSGAIRQYLANRTVIMVTHGRHFEAIADRIMTLESGKLRDT